MSRARWTDELGQDTRFALRTLGRQLGFTAAAVSTLAFGIGATAAILSVVNGVLIRPLPYPHADRAVLVWMTGRGDSREVGRTLPFSAANFTDLRAQATSLERVAAFRRWNYTLVGTGVPTAGAGPESVEPALIAGARVSVGLFEALGVGPTLGRSFQPSDEVPGSEPVAILGEGLWRRRFGGRSDILGRTISLNGLSHTVVGVMPPGFHFPRGAELPPALQFASRTELWTPLVLTPGELQFRGTENLAVLGLIKAGTSIDRVQADLGVVMGRLEELYPQFNTNLSARATPLLDVAVAPVRPALLVLLGAVGFLLLIACVNVSNLLLTRTAARGREVAVRVALGASRRRLIRQFVTENLLLTAAGAVLGFGVAVLAKDGLLALAPSGLPRADDIGVDWRVLGTVLLLVAVVGVGFGALVAAEVVGGSHADGLREGAKGSAGPSRRRLRQGLVVGEVAISVILLSGAGVLARTFENLRRVTPGFSSDRILTARVTLPLNTSNFAEFGRLAPEWTRFYQQLVDDVAARPGIEGAAVATTLPLSGAWETSGFAIDGRPPLPPGQSQSALFAGVSDGYFATLAIPLKAGRFFDTRDRSGDSVGTVIISESMARAYWPNDNPLGARLRGLFRSQLEVIGVVGDVRYRELAIDPMPTMYLPLSVYPGPSMMLVAKTITDPAGHRAAIQAAAKAVGPAVPLTDIAPMTEVLAQSIAQQRFTATLVGGFAVAALGLAVLGLYGVISFGVVRRSREIGVRLALGAAPRQVVGMVVGVGAVLTALGVAVGLGGAVGLGRALSRLVYQVSPSDPATLAAVSVVLASVATVASLIPARRAVRIDPASALREE